MKTGFVAKKLLGTAVRGSRRVPKAFAVLAIVAVLASLLAAPAAAALAEYPALIGTWKAFDTAGTELHVPLLDIFGTDGYKRLNGSPGSMVNDWGPGPDGVPDTYPEPVAYFIDAGRECLRDESPYFYTMPSSGTVCWQYVVPLSTAHPGQWGELVPVTTAAANGATLAFHHFDVTGSPDLAGRCFTGMTGIANHYDAAWVGWKSWVDLNAGTGLNYSVNAIYAPVSPDTSAPIINIFAPLDCSIFDMNQVVTASYNCVDPGGVDPSPACTGDVGNGTPLDTSTPGTYSFSVTGTDVAGNTRTRSITYSVADLTPPAAAPAQTPSANANGWNQSDVTVTWNWSDVGLGIDPGNCSTSSTSSGEGVFILSATCKDLAGNESSASHTVRVDATAPSGTVGQDPAPNANGWNNGDVTVAWNWSDGTSGIDTANCATSGASTGEGSLPLSAACQDLAGNSASANYTVQVDKTSPTVALVGGPAEGGSYAFGSVPAAPACDALDALSGLDGACSVTGYVATLGLHTVTATATDMAGNTNTASATYTVVGWTLGGFYQPVDMGGVWNTVKNGATVPLKFEIFDGPSELTSTSEVQGFAVKGVSCPAESAPTDSIETTVLGGTSLRYDTTAGQFIQTWQTPKKAGACYTATITTLDGSIISANFLLK